MYGEEVLVNLMMWLLFVCWILCTLEPICTNSNCRKSAKSLQLLSDHDTILAFVKAIIILTVMAGGMCWLISLKIKILLILFLVVGLLFAGVTFAVSIVEFIKYIILRPYDYELTKDREKILLLVGFIVYVACNIVVSGMQSGIGEFFANLKVFQADMIQIFILIFWYFSCIFFCLTYITLSVHKIVHIIDAHPIKNVFLKKKEKREEPNKEWKFYSDKILVKIGKTRRKKLKWFGLWLAWLMCICVDAIIMLVITLYDIVKTVFIVVIIAIPKIIFNKLRKLVSYFRQNPGKIIVLNSRLALVSSLLIVYLLDQYQDILSDAGSAVYEFLCSVIIIPFLITQLNDLKNKNMDKIIGKNGDGGESRAI